MRSGGGLDIDAGTVVAQRYRIQRPLGRGGMGEVFAAENIRTGRVVAVKLLRSESKQKTSAVARFRREARAAGAISSDYVTQVLDVEEDDEHGIVIVFELLEGESLIDRLKRTGPMTFEELFPIVEQVWMGLADAHRAGVIHRDLKPSNVFLERRPDSSYRVKILDFGISKLPKEVGGDTLTEMGQSLGTFSFMPPEQIGKAKTVDHRADIYACATLIYQAMSGQLPYAARNILMMVELKTKSEPRPLSEAMGKAVDARLEGFLARSLKREPDQRFQSAMEALEAWRGLRQYSGEVTSARPPPVKGNTVAIQQQMHSQPQQGYQQQQQHQQVSRSASTMPNPTSRSYPNLPAVASGPDTTSDGGSDHVATIAMPRRRFEEALAAAGKGPIPRMHEDRPGSGTQLMSQGMAASVNPARLGGTVAMHQQRLSSQNPQGPVSSQPTYGNVALSDPRHQQQPHPMADPSSGAVLKSNLPLQDSGSQPRPYENNELMTSVYQRKRPSSGKSTALFAIGMIALAVVGFVLVAAVFSYVQTGKMFWQ